MGTGVFAILCLSIHSWAGFCAQAVVLEVDGGVGGAALETDT